MLTNTDVSDENNLKSKQITLNSKTKSKIIVLIQKKMENLTKIALILTLS